MSMMNPEIRRYRWLEFSTHRTVAMPLVIGIVLFLVVQSTKNSAMDAQLSALTAMALAMYGVLIGLWGGHKAAESIVEEVNDNTWDFQRLSSLSPWSLSWGKLLGSTSYCWYGALMALVIYIYAALLTFTPYYVFCNVVLLLACALICHAFAMLSSLQAVQVRAGGRTKIRGIGHHIIGMVLGLYFSHGMKLVPDNYFVSDKLADDMAQKIHSVQWYGMFFESTGFAACVAVIMLGWIIAGVYWQMRMQLRMRSGPWLWLAFLLFMMGFAGGFELPGRGLFGLPYMGLIAAYAIGMLSTYGMAFLEEWGGVSYRRLQGAWRAGRRFQAIEMIPRWCISLGLTFIASCLLLITHLTMPGIYLGAFALLFFAVRDIAILHYFVLAPNNRRATAAALFYLGVLYILIPVLLGVLGANDAVALFMPIGDHTPSNSESMLSFLSAFVQACIAMMFVRKRWRKHWQ